MLLRLGVATGPYFVRTYAQQNRVTIWVVCRNHPAVLPPQAGQELGPGPAKRELRLGDGQRRRLSLGAYRAPQRRQPLAQRRVAQL